MGLDALPLSPNRVAKGHPGVAKVHLQLTAGAPKGGCLGPPGECLGSLPFVLEVHSEMGFTLPIHFGVHEEACRGCGGGVGHCCEFPSVWACKHRSPI